MRMNTNLWTVTARNNHCIGPGALYSQAPADYPPNVASNNLSQSLTAATSAGYTLTNLYRSVSTSSPTVGKGYNLSAVFTTDLLSANRTVPFDVGAYQYSGGSAQVTLMPPTNLTIVP
jgi:hypothetical protein